MNTKSSLDQRLRLLLKSIFSLARTTDIISINASIAASRMPTGEGRAFKEIAKEIRDISSKSLQDLQDLEEVLDGVKKLSGIINVAGRQRMLAQKTMKLKLLLDLGVESGGATKGEFEATIHLFESSHANIRASSINTPDINARLDSLNELWMNFKRNLFQGALDDTNELNNKVVVEMNAIVGLYQELSG